MEANYGYTKNRLFAKYGHHCEMPNELDEIPNIIPGKNAWARFKRRMLRLRTVSEVNTYGNRILRSQGAIANEKRRHLHNYRHTIHPFSDVRSSWMVFMCFVLVVQFIMVPLDFAYFLIPGKIFCHTKVWKWARTVFDLLCMVDLLLNFFTGYYNYARKEVVMSQTRIVSHYFTTYFTFDLLSSFPTHFDLFLPINVGGTANTILQSMSLLKLLRMYTFSTYVTEFSQVLDIPYAIHRIMMILIGTLLYFHVLACSIIFSEAYASDFFEDSRKVKETGMVHQSYVAALYLGSIVTATAGYGKRVPTTVSGNIMMILSWIISTIVRVVLVVRLMQIVKATLSSNHNYVGMVRQLSEYMKYKGLPENTQRRLLVYYEFRFQKNYFRQNEILATLSGQLRQEIVMHSSRKLVENVTFFKSIPLNLLVRIVSCLRSEIFLVNDVVVKAKTPGNSMYFIASGTVAVYTASGREFTMVPLDVALFRSSEETFCDSLYWIWTRTIFDCLCMTDVAINFFTGFYSNSKRIVVLSHKDITTHYLSTFFIFDFLSSIPTHFELVFVINKKSNFIVALQAASLLKLLRVHTFLTYFNDFAAAFELSYIAHNVIRLGIGIILYLHWVACGLIFGEAYSSGSLGDNFNASRAENVSSYVGAFYHGAIIVTNADYGLHPPETLLGSMLMIALWVVSRGGQLYLVIRLMHIVKATLSSHHKYVGMVRQLKEYMRYKGLPEYTQRRLLIYYEFRFQNNYFRETEIMATISGHIRQEIVMHSCRRLVENVAFFKNIPLNLLVRIVSCLRSEIFLVNDVVIKSNTSGDSMYFISSGTVAVYTSSGREEKCNTQHVMKVCPHDLEALKKYSDATRPRTLQ